MLKKRRIDIIIKNCIKKFDLHLEKDSKRTKQKDSKRIRRKKTDNKVFQNETHQGWEHEKTSGDCG